MHFYIQSSFLPDEATLPTIEALNELGIDWCDIGILPFSTEITNLQDHVKPPFVFLGSCKMVEVIDKHYRDLWSGIFYRPFELKASVWSDALPGYMLNENPTIIKIEDLLTSRIKPDRVFIRPNNDLKTFAGTVIERDGVQKWYDETLLNGEPLPLDTWVVISVVRNIQTEWRCFVVGAKVIAGSQYRNNGKMDVVEGLPDEVHAFAQEAISEWCPGANVVVDVCRTVEGELKIVEFNCFNAAGWYKTDRKKVLKALANYMIWTTNNPGTLLPPDLYEFMETNEVFNAYNPLP